MMSSSQFLSTNAVHTPSDRNLKFEHNATTAISTGTAIRHSQIQSDDPIAVKMKLDASQSAADSQAQDHSVVIEENLQSPSSMTPLSDQQDNENGQNHCEYEERFRVDRRKLEQMLHGNGNGPTTEAEDFFLEVMDTTNTQITWPSKLKIGAKSKKDPHIKVSGEPTNVKKAKEKIMAVLDTKSNRVTLKMDVSHTEHSHVIGKGGNNIKRVMDDTGCHIHFPDSNRNNQSDKSNQVSIAGQPFGVECARRRIRELLPISFTFEIPLSGLMHIQLDQASPVISRIQQQYGVMVSFKQRPRSIIVVVRGTVINAKSLKEATVLLMEHLTGNIGSLIPVSLQLEVAAQHHLFMIGRGGSNLQQIMAKTGASICFPDISSPKGTIVITGSIENTLAARNCIVGCLPVVLMFDMKEDMECDIDSINMLMDKLDVYISVKPKPKQPSKSVIVKSIEDNVSNMYEARRLLLKLDKEEMPDVSKTGRRIDPPITSSMQGLLAHHNLLNIATAAQTKPYVMVNHSLSPGGQGQTHISTHPAQTSPQWLSAQGVLNPSIMMIPNTPVSNPQLSHDVKKAMQRPVQYKDLNENSSYTYNTNPNKPSLSQQSAHRMCVTTNSSVPLPSPKQADKPQMYMMRSSPTSVSPQNLPNGHHPQNITNGHHFTPANELCAINGRATPPSIEKNLGSLVTHSANVPLQPVDLDALTKTLKKDLNLNSSGAHLMESLSHSVKLHSSGSGADLRGVHQMVQQQAAPSPVGSRRSFSLSMSLNASRGSVSEAAVNSMTGAADAMFDKKAPGIERHADRLLTTANEQLMSSYNDRLMASASRSSGLMKPPPGLTQPPDGAVNPANVPAALADYERKKVMASKAIEQEPSGETRNPTDFWSGLGFSRSMPDSVIRDRLKQNGLRYDGSNMATTYEQESEEDGDPWKDSSPSSSIRISSDLIEKIEQYGDMLNTSLGRSGKQMESPTLQPSSFVGSSNDNSDMAELFRKLGLEKYTELFLQQEIDLATFTTLNDQDLKELGINTFGARRKMLLAIADLQKSRQKFFSPTPGSNNPFRSVSASGGPFPHSGNIISHSGRW